MEKTILTCGLVITGMLSVAFTQVEKHIIQKHNTLSLTIAATEKSENSISFQDTTKKFHTISTTVAGKTYRIVSKNNVVTELYINNVRIPNEKLKDYKLTTDKILKDTENAKLQAQKTKAAAEQTKRLAETKKKTEQAKAATKPVEKYQGAKIAAKNAKEWEDQTKLYVKNSKIESEEIKTKTEEIDRKIEELRELRDELKREERMERENRIDRDERIEKQEKIESGLRETEGSLNGTGRNRDRADRLDRATSPVREKRSERVLEYAPGTTNGKITPLKPLKPFEYRKDSLTYRSTRPLTPLRPAFGENIITELLDLGIITDRRVTYHMTNDELIVNGVKQSEEVHKKVLSKIGKNASGKIDFNYSGNSVNN